MYLLYILPLIWLASGSSGKHVEPAFDAASLFVATKSSWKHRVQCVRVDPLTTKVPRYKRSEWYKNKKNAFIYCTLGTFALLMQHSQDKQNKDDNLRKHFVPHSAPQVLMIRHYNQSSTRVAISASYYRTESLLPDSVLRSMMAALVSCSSLWQVAAKVCVGVLVPFETIVLLTHHSQVPQKQLDSVHVAQPVITHQQPLRYVVAHPLISL